MALQPEKPGKSRAPTSGESLKNFGRVLKKQRVSGNKANRLVLLGNSEEILNKLRKLSGEIERLEEPWGAEMGWLDFPVVVLVHKGTSRVMKILRSGLASLATTSQLGDSGRRICIVVSASTTIGLHHNCRQVGYESVILGSRVLQLDCLSVSYKPWPSMSMLSWHTVHERIKLQPRCPLCVTVKAAHADLVRECNRTLTGAFLSREVFLGSSAVGCLDASCASVSHCPARNHETDSTTEADSILRSISTTSIPPTGLAAALMSRSKASPPRGGTRASVPASVSGDDPKVQPDLEGIRPSSSVGASGQGEDGLGDQGGSSDDQHIASPSEEGGRSDDNGDNARESPNFFEEYNAFLAKQDDIVGKKLDAVQQQDTFLSVHKNKALEASPPNLRVCRSCGVARLVADPDIWFCWNFLDVQESASSRPRPSMPALSLGPAFSAWLTRGVWLSSRDGNSGERGSDALSTVVKLVATVASVERVRLYERCPSGVVRGRGRLVAMAKAVRTVVAEQSLEGREAARRAGRSTAPSQVALPRLHAESSEAWLIAGMSGRPQVVAGSSPDVRLSWHPTVIVSRTACLGRSYGHELLLRSRRGDELDLRPSGTEPAIMTGRSQADSSGTRIVTSDADIKRF
ncbi:uncharacterized protein B0I36DRAFT_350530 [Microdochium trichocladiopsis]|uniref:Uncharacterized protein n=1 Tax=Microdochium trichocladiopsis TaxID=1682393 RepID=A0A9P8Y4R4_9PEZI|nr:uncharacterized protein B0I36DRAFT_350530 [Microdochium trichocladiopsis]KAH7029703.1 hypothetical protein B0I36DRAFT_350530 [Microdochium trichocladiopsis]